VYECTASPGNFHGMYYNTQDAGGISILSRLKELYCCMLLITY